MTMITSTAAQTTDMISTSWWLSEGGAVVDVFSLIDEATVRQASRLQLEEEDHSQSI